MKKLLTLLLLLITSLTLAQSTGNYTYSTSTTGSLTLDKDGNTIDMSTGTTTLYGPNVDTYTATVQSLGFDFVFMGTIYNQFSVSPDGGLRFGSTAISGHTYSPAANTPIISLTNIDNKTGVGTGKVHYKVQSGTGGQVLIVEWKDILINWNATGTTLSTFQLRLYQATGQIEMVYGQMWNSSTSAQSGVIWFGSSNTSGTVGQLNNITTTPTYNSTATTLTTTSFTASSAMTNLHSTSDGSRRVFTFTPPAAPAAPTGLSFSGITMTAMTLNWTDNATTETGYLVYRSLDGVTYTLIATLAANSTSYNATGLGAATTYHWRVVAINEGRLSSPLDGSQATSSGTLSGTRTIGPSGDYSTLTAAITDIQTNGLAGPLILEFLSGYTSGSETFPITFTNLTTSHTSTLTVRPQSGVTGISISSSNTTAIIRIVNEDYIFIDGRPGGTGTDREITITNTGAGPTILFIDDASNNTVRYCNVVGSANTSNTSGVIFFSTTANTTGNDNNTIEYCDINALGSAVGIYSAGTTGKENNDNTISNNRIRDFYISSTSTTPTYGIRIHTASTKFTISGNSLYQTAPRAYSTTAVTHYGISLNNTSGNEFTITNNFIGGSDVNCGGSPYTFSTGSARFWAMEINVGTTTATSIQGNTIANFNVNSGFTTSGSTLFGGMVISAGATNVGTTSGNTIGSTSGTSITVNLTAAAAGPIIAGIATTGGTPHNINNNTIAGITVTATSATAYGNLYAISLGSTGAVTTVDGNTIGSSSGSINNNSGSGVVSAQYVTAGIRVTFGSGTTGITINNNTIQYMNMPAGASNTGATLYGLQLTSTGTVYTVTNNIIRNLTTGSARISATTSASLIGINHQGTTSPTIIRGNTVHSLSQTDASAAVVVYGILASGTTSGNFELSGNFVHSISLATSSTTAILEGIYFASGVYRVFNNMVRLGIDAAGNSVSGNFSISGIRKATSSNQTIVFNSIFIGGSVASSSVNTFGLRRTLVGTSDSIYNNIFVNSRSNTSGTARHYAISTSSASGLEDYNLFFANGTGGAVGSVNDGTTAQTTLANYQSAFSGRNINSGYGAPNYVDATGDASAVDLHVQSPTAAEGWGSTAFNYISTDFDGETRSSLTPVDIGADAGNFTFDDIFPPVITYTVLGNTASIANRTLASVTITDLTGVPTTGSLQPRIWFRRSAPTPSSWGSTQGSLQSGSGTNGVWSFTIDYSVLSITPTVGETYEYYVVAQDGATTPNISTNPAGGVHTDVNTQTSAPTTPNSYDIVTGISGTVTVGTGGTYSTLTGTGGLFDVINNQVLTGNLTANIISDITELGTVGLNQMVVEGGNWTLTIQPDSATVRNITGNLANGLIRLNGADRVTIDGRFSGSGNYLSFTNNNNTASAAVIWVNSQSATNPATDVTIRNCIVTGGGSSTLGGIIVSGSTMGGVAEADNTNTKILFNQVRKAQYGIALVGNSTGQTNSEVLNNNVGSTTPADKISFVGIFISNQQDCQVSNNTVIGLSSSVSNNSSAGISIVGVSLNSVVNANEIADIKNTNTNGWAATGILLGSSSTNTNLRVSNNVIYDIAGYGYNANITDNGIGIRITSGGGYNIAYNSVNLATDQTVAGQSTAILINAGTGHLIRNNVFVNSQTTGTRYSIYSGVANTAFTTINNNNYFSSQHVGFLTSNRTTLSAWQTATGQDANSYSGDPGFTANDNLLPDNTNPNCWNLNGKGVPISGISTDFAGNSRSTSVANGSTDIGAFEFSTSTTPPAASQTGTIAVDSTTTYSVSGTQVGSIQWVIGPGLPSSVTFRYYSGTQAPFTGTQPRINAYWDVTQSGGTSFTYNITFTYDEAQLGNINENNLIPAKSDDGGTTWTPYTTIGTNPGEFQRDTTLNTITLYGMTSFSFFTLGDNTDPLPVQLSSFTASVNNRDITLNWRTETEVNSAKFELERKYKDNEWTSIAEVKASGNSNSPKEYSYLDKKLNSGVYQYRLKMIDNDGTYSYSDVVEGSVELPKEYGISQNYPNPFNPTTRIDYQLPFDSKVMVELYSITGEKVGELINGINEAGYYNIEVNGSSLRLSSGVYIYRIIATNLTNGQVYMNVKKMMMIK